jgi:eukaryotic-like serine/threonine-protein kinase
MPAGRENMTERVIGHYRIIEKIGAGAMGEVFRARDERLGRDVAIKVIHSSSVNNADLVRRFELEARAAAALNHPNIVAIYDVGLDEGSPYIVCELLSGLTLRQRLVGGPLPVKVAVDYSVQLVHGLIAAHERGIIHRDLKPENLFVMNDGRIKILDFGVAKLQAGSDESGRTVEELTTITKSGAVVGTLAYMSPEQLRGRTVDHRSDIFSVGGILYEVLTGRRPFRGETEVDTITAVLREDPPEIDLERARIPLSCQQIIRHCLEKEPEKRFQTAQDLAFALETLSDSSTGRMRLSPRRVRGKILPWAIAGALLIATLLLAGRLAQEATESATYQRVTFEEGTLYSARFAPGFHSVVYSAAWNGRPLQLFSTVGDSFLAQPLNITDANLLAISPTGEMALTVNGIHTDHLKIEKGVLAQAPLAGGSPRQVLEDVRWADWSRNGELAIVHYAQGRERIEYPIGKVLYESSGWISHIRLSPEGNAIAFINHPSLWDDRGLICLLDLSGRVKLLSREWDSADGLAWSPNGKEIWFTAAEKGYTRSLLAVDRKGRIRTILRIPAGLTVQDIAPDGRVLLSLDVERLEMATLGRDGRPIDISWHDWDIAKDISPDGQSILFEDASEAAPPDYMVAIRRLDGTPPIQLGEGSAGALSPDGKWAIGIIIGNPGKITLYPIGPGQARTIPVTGLERIDNGSSHFLPDGKRITINGIEPGHNVRCYIESIDGGKPIAVTPEGITGGYVAPDGRHMLANDGTVITLDANGSAPHPIPGINPEFKPIQWSADSTAVYGFYPGGIPVRVLKVDIATGRTTFIRDLQPETTTGLVAIKPVVMNRDASRFAFSYYQVFSGLYVVSGLR